MYNLSYNQNLDNDFIEKEKKKIKLIGKLINLLKTVDANDDCNFR